MIELKNHKNAYFVTLTYDDEHVPLNDTLDYDTGEFLEASRTVYKIKDEIQYSNVHGIMTLDKRDCQLFIKRLRDHFDYPDGFMYFLAGEYSPKMRPHYHAIMYDLPVDDLEVYSKNEFGDLLYTSETINKLWAKGYVVLGEVTWEACCYVARYILKKQKGQTAEIYEKYNFEPEFTLMSRRPAIGLEYYEQNKDKIFSQDSIYVGTKKGSVSVKPPRYYEKKFEVDDPEEFRAYKENKQFLLDCSKIFKAEKTSLDYLDRLAVEERNVIAKTKIFNLRKEL